jgi:DNA-binding CsgD family transcriptional regulator
VVGLVGRTPESEQIAAALDEAARGRGRALVLRGPPGIGKTALIEEAVRGAHGFRVLRTRCQESEAGLPFAALSDLLRPVLECLPIVPPPQRAALRAALALGPPVAPDRFAAYAAALSLLGAVAHETPVLLVVDDAQWLDAPSREALIFCARRIEDEPIAVLGASRELAPERANVPGVAEVALGPLRPADAQALLARSTRDSPLAPSVAGEVLAVAEGNPLALVELPAAMSGDERTGRVPLPRPLRAGEAIAGAYRRRVEGLPQPARRALTVAAVSGDGALGPVVAALADLGGGRGDLEAAEAAGFLALGDGVLEMRHPVLRSVVLELTPPLDRRAAHQALAAVLDPEHDSEARAWHLAEAAVGPDEEAAAALEEAAERAAQRTGYAAAVSALVRAAALSSGRGDRARRLLAAGHAARHAGLLERCLELLEAARLETTDPAMRAEAGHLKGVVTTWIGPVPAGAAALLAEADRIGADAPGLAAAMLADAVVAHSLAAQGDRALATARKGLSLARGGGPEGLAISSALLGWALTMCGERRAAIACMAPLDRVAADVPVMSLVGHLVGSTALCNVWLDREAVAAARLAPWLDAARASGSVEYTVHALVIAAEVSLRAARFEAARAEAIEALRLLEESRQLSLLGYTHGVLAQAQAVLGDAADCEASCRAAETLSTASGTDSGRFLAAQARAHSKLAGGDVEVALADLRWIEAGFAERGLREPNLLRWQPDLVEALVFLDRRDKARRALAALAEQAWRGGGAWARAVACRGRGVLDADFDRHFVAALALHRTPFERARTQLAYGARLRRARRRTEARDHLERALAGFEACSAVPWARRAREEMAASGLGLPRRGHRGRTLSPREHQVAEAAAAGLTNREVAARMFLSEKTVERHLGSVYRKLGLRSRTELARRFAEDRAGAGP